MLISVYRDILDNSISGDKIYGGTIDQIDKIITDGLEVPGTGTGYARISGGDVSLGWSHLIDDYSPILEVFSRKFGAIEVSGFDASIFALNESLKTVFQVSVVSEIATLTMRQADGTAWHRLSTTAGAHSYIGGKLSVNTTDAPPFGVYLYVNGDIQASSLSVATITDVSTMSVVDLYLSSAGIWLESWYDDFVILESTVSGYASNLSVITESVISGALANIENDIDGSQWAYVGFMDQRVDSNYSSGPTFKNLTISGSGQLSILGSVVANSVWPFVKLMDQSVASGVNVTFGRVTATDFATLITAGGANVDTHEARLDRLDGGTKDNKEFQTTMLVLFGASPLAAGDSKKSAEIDVNALAGWSDLDNQDVILVSKIGPVGAGDADWNDNETRGLILSGVVTDTNKIVFFLCNCNSVATSTGAYAGFDISVRVLRKL